MANLVASGLFGDGAAAVVAVGDRRAERIGASGPGCSTPAATSTRTRSARWAGTSARRVPARAVARGARGGRPLPGRRHHGLAGRPRPDVGEVGAWVCHPGGPKIIEAITATLGSARRRPGNDLALAGRGRQSVVGVGAARAARHPGPAAAAGQPRRADGDGPGVLLRTRPAALALSGTDPMLWYTLLIAAVAVERIAELVVSKRNLAWSQATGRHRVRRAVTTPPWSLLHTGLLVGCLVEASSPTARSCPRWAGRCWSWCSPPRRLRWWCITTLGHRWNTRVIVVPGAPRVTGGPYRLLRHPNYVAVVIEGIALPLVHPRGSPRWSSRCSTPHCCGRGSGWRTRRWRA